ncbi:PolB1-binding protein PBP2 family protein [Metallosphaera javensis (ex Sakai et al. 2022)]|uniref:PolB1-binding protein PBP2 family protein n=1 Tax=Metallosphaera javensis (ex Sakai et al. 2022) TaxID=2775498 RepID=UPI00258D12FA|nr:MAG: hypothetical protein MjAS7_0234 [Metallosphaera javensis (ex Sakai et al. 2022)]
MSDSRELEIARKYFQTNLSVGEIIAVRDLKGLGIREPERVIAELIRQGVIVKGEGCYNFRREKRKE